MSITFMTAAVRLTGDSKVEVRRTFEAPQALVYRAYTDPALVRRWLLGPPGWAMPVCEMDVRVGGKYRWRWRSEEDGKEFGFHGAFTQVQAPERLAHTQFYDPGDVGGDMGEGAHITVVLDEEAGFTTMLSVMDFHTKEARDAAVATGMTDGMEQSYKLLEQLLAAQRAA